MADEQTIYLSPEEELTSVRERLERTQARRIILVIPQQTQLRSHVGWRLIYARMRELEKELLVISPDQQVRAVARAAGFKVAESQEASSNRPRLGSRAGNMNTRGSGRSRIGGSRSGVSDSRTSRSQSLSPRRPGGTNAGNRPLTQPSAFPSNAGSEEEKDAFAYPAKREMEPASGSMMPPPAFFETPEEQPSASARVPRIHTTPSVHPVVSDLSEEGDEEDFQYDYGKDYDTAQRIRNAVREGGAQRPSPFEEQPEEKESRIPFPGKRGEIDPYAFMEDDQQLAPLPEQRGSAPGSIEEVDMETLDISDRSTELMAGEIEDLGDQGLIDLPEVQSGRGQNPAARPLREQGGRPRTRNEQMQLRHLPRSPRPQSGSEEDEGPLPLTERPTRGGTASQRPSRNLSRQGRQPSQPIGPEQLPRKYSQPIGPEAQRRYSQPIGPEQLPRKYSQPIGPEAPRRYSQPIAPEAGTSTRARPTPGTTGAGQRQLNRQLAPLSNAGGRPSQKGLPLPRRQRRSRRGLALLLSVLAVLLLVAIVLLFVMPSATVTISLQARTFSQTVHFTATSNPQNSGATNVQAQTLTQDFSLSGSGSAGGTTTVGNKKAQGNVTFTNNGTKDFVIPSDTIVQTQNGVQFVTGAEAHVTPGADNAVPVPVTAVQAGNNGNVAAATITVIPAASQQNIARWTGNVSVADVKSLSATNLEAVTGGGAVSEPAATAKDLSALTQALHQKLQSAVKTWLAGQTHTGDLAGKVVPDVLDSSKPLAIEKLSNAPSVNEAVSSGKFSGTLTVHIQVLIARAATLQAAAGTQLNSAAMKLSPARTLATSLPVTLTKVQSTPSSDGTGLAITASASGETITFIDPQALSNNLTIKGVSQAESYLQTGSMAQAEVLHVNIALVPSFFPFLPLRASQIRIILQPVPATSGALSN